jgi:hypothetical protein
MASSSPESSALLSTLNQILHNQQTFQLDLASLTTEMGQLRTRLPPPGFTPFSPETPQPHQFSTTTIKLDIPRFNGSDALSWIFKINQFFDFHQTVDEQRLRITSFYMKERRLHGFSGCIQMVS